MGVNGREGREGRDGQRNQAQGGKGRATERRDGVSRGRARTVKRQGSRAAGSRARRSRRTARTSTRPKKVCHTPAPFFCGFPLDTPREERREKKLCHDPAPDFSKGGHPQKIRSTFFDCPCTAPCAARAVVVSCSRFRATGSETPAENRIAEHQNNDQPARLGLCVRAQVSPQTERVLSCNHERETT